MFRVEETSDRLRKALSLRGLTQAELSDRTKISKAQISSYLSGRYNPREDNIERIANALAVSSDWLKGYDVPISGIPTPIFSDWDIDKINVMMAMFGVRIDPSKEEDAPLYSVIYHGQNLGDKYLEDIFNIYERSSQMKISDVQKEVDDLLGRPRVKKPFETVTYQKIARKALTLTDEEQNTLWKMMKAVFNDDEEDEDDQ